MGVNISKVSKHAFQNSGHAIFVKVFFSKLSVQYPKFKCSFYQLDDYDGGKEGNKLFNNIGLNKILLFLNIYMLLVHLCLIVFTSKTLYLP